MLYDKKAKTIILHCCVFKIDSLLATLEELQDRNKELFKLKYRTLQGKLLNNYLMSINESTATILEATGIVNSEAIDSKTLTGKTEIQKNEIISVDQVCFSDNTC